ncbi:MAG: cbb3-type cytochrome c oxidase subunit I [Hyphomicrobiales bacterium]
MAAMLEREEWKAFSDFLALGGAALCVIIGLILALAGADRVIAFHGCILLGVAGLAFLYILTNIIEKKEPHDATGYADGVIRAGVIATVFWGLAGFLVGDIIAWQLAFPVFNFDLPWTNFGRLRPVHTSAVIFAFGGNALIATSFYCVVQRTCRARASAVVAVVCVLGLPTVPRARGHRLHPRRHQSERSMPGLVVRRSRITVVGSSISWCSWGRSPSAKSRISAWPTGSPPRLHRHRRPQPAYRQQSGGADLPGRL